eukprot:COSAG01_NODE_28_length_36622_cov_14.695751_18_plen_169_part_00
MEGCLFERLDGNAVMISGYSRNTTVRDNEFHLVGENGVVSWGYTADFADVKRAVPIPKTQGPDMRDGNHPQGNLIDSNFFHEIGHFQKQISWCDNCCCYVRAATFDLYVYNIIYGVATVISRHRRRARRCLKTCSRHTLATASPFPLCPRAICLSVCPVLPALCLSSG